MLTRQDILTVSDIQLRHTWTWTLKGHDCDALRCSLLFCNPNWAFSRIFESSSTLQTLFVLRVTDTQCLSDAILDTVSSRIETYVVMSCIRHCKDARCECEKSATSSVAMTLICEYAPSTRVQHPLAIWHQLAAISSSAENASQRSSAPLASHELSPPPALSESYQ